MDRADIPVNSMKLILLFDEDSGEMNVRSEFNLSETMDPEQAQFLADVFNGLYIGFEPMLETFAYIGQVTRLKEELENEFSNMEGFVFEPDSDLIQAVSDARVIPFNKNKLN